MSQKSIPKVLDVLVNQASDHEVGVVGSPTNTTEIVIDIKQDQETSRALGQLVYLVVDQEDSKLAVIGQITQVETRNRWHEDMTFRGIIKRRGELPHLSGRADVRTATISVQAAFAFRPDAEGNENVTESILAISPSTGARVYRVRDEVLDALLQRYRGEVIYLGHAYGTDVRMPFWLKHFGKEKGGAGEAYHIGVFGKTGSGKSGLAAYLVLGYARHKQMGILLIDPQGQFSIGRDLPFDLQRRLRLIGRRVEVYQLSTQIRLPKNIPLFCRLLKKTGFYRRIQVRASENQDFAAEELAKAIHRELQSHNTSLDDPPDDLMLAALTRLGNDPDALSRIYRANTQPYRQVESYLQRLQFDSIEREELEREAWTPVLDLFRAQDSRGNRRKALSAIIGDVIGTRQAKDRPVIFLDISGTGTAFGDDEEMKALVLREISNTLRWQGEEAFKQDRKLNCLVVLDEAHRFASVRRTGDESEMAALTRSFVQSVRETRKYGLGYLFITQTLASLHPEIVQQLRINFFGHGLNMGSEFAKLKELIGGNDQALALYTSFVDPQSTASKQFPFMFTGPASPLSFTGAPLFVQIFTDFNDFISANPFFR